MICALSLDCIIYSSKWVFNLLVFDPQVLYQPFQQQNQVELEAHAIYSTHEQVLLMTLLHMTSKLGRGDSRAMTRCIKSVIFIFPGQLWCNYSAHKPVQVLIMIHVTPKPDDSDPLPHTSIFCVLHVLHGFDLPTT